MTNVEIIKKLIGPIEPIGETNTDATRLENLKETIAVVEALLIDISRVSRHKEVGEYSINVAGKEAAKFIHRVNEFSRIG